MKRLSHNFVIEPYIVVLNYFPYSARCTICNKTAGEMSRTFKYRDRKDFDELDIGNNIKDKELKIYNKCSPCLTEDEYIIKGIIE